MEVMARSNRPAERREGAAPMGLQGVEVVALVAASVVER